MLSGTESKTGAQKLGRQPLLAVRLGPFLPLSVPLFAHL